LTPRERNKEREKKKVYKASTSLQNWPCSIYRRRKTTEEKKKRKRKRAIRPALLALYLLSERVAPIKKRKGR